MSDRLNNSLASTQLEREIFGTFFDINNPTIKSYKTRANLASALHKMGATRRHNILPVCTSNGRWTAIVPVSACQGNLTAFPGFMKLG